MIFPLFRRTARQNTISTLYGTIVAQARLPCFYREYAVADTVNGRFDLLVLHLVAVLDRLSEDSALRDKGQALFDRFCQDMDHNLRPAQARLAAYMREAVRQIRGHQSAKLLSGDLRLPDPDSVVLVEDKDHLSED
ncbi:MAG TPA: ubiquinol-cytochrome C chaperone family protein [Pseudolabrys sp.]